MQEAPPRWSNAGKGLQMLIRPQQEKHHWRAVGIIEDAEVMKNQTDENLEGKKGAKNIF